MIDIAFSVNILANAVCASIKLCAALLRVSSLITALVAVRLAFSIATVVESDILIMDEWLSVGDAAFSDKAQARLSEVVNATKILVLATHSRALLERICTRAIWLEHGKVVMDGPVGEVAKSYFHE
jgi:ABC-type polysaccharide/polyol phosphate transport system ATPase subunit